MKGFRSKLDRLHILAFFRLQQYKILETIVLTWLSYLFVSSSHKFKIVMVSNKSSTQVQRLLRLVTSVLNKFKDCQDCWLQFRTSSKIVMIAHLSSKQVQRLSKIVTSVLNKTQTLWKIVFLLGMTVFKYVKIVRLCITPPKMAIFENGSFDVLVKILCLWV